MYLNGDAFARSYWRLTALSCAVALLVASACSRDVPCSGSGSCAAQVVGGAPQAGEGGLSTEDATSAGGALAGSHADGGDTAQGGESRAAAFGGESTFGGRFTGDAGSSGLEIACTQLHVPLLVSRNFTPPRQNFGCPDRAPFAAGDCFAADWSGTDLKPLTWAPIVSGAYCLEHGATRVRFWARVEAGEQLVTFSVAPSLTLGPTLVTSSWTQYEIPIVGLDHVRFDAPDWSEPAGLTPLSVQPAPPARVYVDDLRWVGAKAPTCADPGCE